MKTETKKQQGKDLIGAQKGLDALRRAVKKVLESEAEEAAKQTKKTA